MATYTKNYNLKKPAQEDFYNVDDFNENANTIDTEIIRVRDMCNTVAESVEKIPNDYYKKAQTDQKISTAVSTHDSSPSAHGDVRAGVVALESRIKNIETIVGGGITTNPFSVTFTTLTGVTVTGVWNNAQGRIEF